MSVYGTSAVRRLSKSQTLKLDEQLFEIVEREQPTSVRGMYYQAMGHDLVDKDQAGKRNNYLRIQRRILALRRSGYIPYSWITDGSRPVYGRTRYNDPDAFARQVAGQYRKEYWQDSPVRVEVWVEKDAMAGKLCPVVVEECGLDLYVSRGFSSETYLHTAGATIRADGRPTYVYILTDHDASGMGIADTVERDLPKHAAPAEVVVQRLAVTPEQVKEFGLITQPVTRTDARAREFVRRYGSKCAELDAIPANAVRALVQEAVERHIEPRRLRLLKTIEEQERNGLYERLGGVALASHATHEGEEELSI
jgi:hypothetical protein